MTEKEKNDKLGSYLGYYSLIIFLFLVGACMNDVDLKSVDTSQKNVQKVETKKNEKTPEKTPEQIQAEKIQKNVERANNLNGDEKNLYDIKFKEYLNGGQDENSSREKALADVDELIRKKDYEKRQAEEAEKSRILAEQRAEESRKYLEKNYKNAYSFCYWMFYKIGYSDDVLQYHLNSGDSDAMSDLKFVMNKFINDLNDEWKYSVDTNFPDDLKNLMYKAKGNLQKSFQLRKNGIYSEIQQSDELENEVVQQLIQIQQMLPEGVKMWSYQGIYDSNDEIDIPSEYKDDSKVTGTIGDWNESDDDRVYGQIGPNLIGE